MKYIFSTSILFYAILYINIFYAADTAQYTITSYDDARDHDAVFTLISNKFEEFAARSDGKPLDKIDIEGLSKKLHKALHDKCYESPLLKAVENSFHRIVLRKQSTLIGFAEFFLNLEDYDSMHKNDGYIETMLIENQYSDAFDILMKEIFTKLCALEARRTAIHFIDNKLQEQRAYQAALKAGFIKQSQTDFEKKHRSIRFVKDLQG